MTGRPPFDDELPRASRGFQPSPDFQPSELDEGGLDLLPTARRVERYVNASAPTPPPDFATRVMAAVAQEPVPTPPARFLRALGALSLGGMVANFGAMARAAFGIGRSFPVAVRAQALALVIVSLVALTGLGAAVTVGGSLILERINATPEPSRPLPSPSLMPSTTEPSPTPIPTETGSPWPTDGPTMEPTYDPSHSYGDPSERPTEESMWRPPPSPSETVTPRPTRTADPTRSATPRPTRTPRPTETETARPTKAPKPCETLKPGETLEPGETLKPCETPHGGSGPG